MPASRRKASSCTARSTSNATLRVLQSSISVGFRTAAKGSGMAAISSERRTDGVRTVGEAARGVAVGTRDHRRHRRSPVPSSYRPYATF